MVMSQSAVRELVHDQLFPAFDDQREKLERIDGWYRFDPEKLKLPRDATREHKWLEELSRTPWLNLVVTTVAQAMYVDGFVSPTSGDDVDVWRTWNANGFDARQVAIHRAALAYGQAYVLVTPGTDASGPRSVMRGISPRRMYVQYADKAEDDWPMFGLRADAASRSKWMLRVYDDEAVYYLSCDASGDGLEFIEWREHAADVCPIVRYTNALDLDGRTHGEVEPLIPLAIRINKTAYDRLLTQHFNSWKIRTIAGIDLSKGPVDSDGDGTITDAERRQAAERAKMLLRQSDMLTAADPNTKFGTLDETPLDGFVNAYGADVDTLAAVAQVPATSLNGKVANLSADAITELHRGLTQKVYERQRYFGQSHAQALRLAARLEGQDVDPSARITWQDTEVRSMSQAADALGKYAQMLEVPVEALWQRIPGVTKTDVDEWKAISRRGAAAGIASAAQQARQDPTVARLTSRGNQG
ncbi:MAG TPA: phage portal protein [Nocardioidaceae bacterium]|nr:phage portal protein [Nocardioidaceae bacterium]